MVQIKKSDGADNSVIIIGNEEFATSMARRIVLDYMPKFMDHFIAKNRKYRKVTNNLGARGVYPDVNRKCGILEARVWDGDEPTDGAESTVEVIDDLIGHLFIMRDMLLQEALPEWDGTVGRVMALDEPSLPGDEPHEHILNDLQNCEVLGCNYAHVGKPLHTGDLLPDLLTHREAMQDNIGEAYARQGRDPQGRKLPPRVLKDNPQA